MKPRRSTLKKPHKSLVTGDLSLIPLGVGTSVGDYLQKAYKAMQSISDATLYPTGMSTIIEAPDLQTIFKVVEKGRQEILSMGVQRIYIVLKIDDRHDSPHGVMYKKTRMTGKPHES